MDPRLRHFIDLFNSRKFFEAHEVLEELWLQTTGPQRDFYKGLIQCAAAFVHVQRKNPQGALRLYQRARHYLSGYLPIQEQLNTEQLLADCDHCFAAEHGSVDLPVIRTL